jgi:hypothetical protein
LIGKFFVGERVGVRVGERVGVRVGVRVGDFVVGDFVVGNIAEGTAANGALVFLEVGVLDGTAAAVGGLVFLVRVRITDFKSFLTSKARLLFEKVNLIKKLIEVILNPLGSVPTFKSSQIKELELWANFDPPEKCDPVIGETARISEALVNFKCKRSSFKHCIPLLKGMDNSTVADLEVFEINLAVYFPLDN